MNERRMQFGVGVLVFATMIIGGLLATVNEPMPAGWLPWGRARYGVGIQLREAPGVGPNTPIRKNGILIGRVKAIEDLQDGIVVRANIDGDRPLFPEYQPHVRTSVLGDATIDFVTRPLAPGSQAVPDGTVFRGVVDPNPFDSLAKLGDLQADFAAASRSLAGAGEEVEKLAKRVNEAFGDETEEGRVSRLLDTTERAMNQFAQTMSAFNEIIGDAPADVHQPSNVPRPFNGRPPANGQQPLNMRPQGGAPPPQGQSVKFQQPNVVPPVAQPPLDDPLLGGQQPVEGPELRRRLREGLNELPEAVRDARITMQKFQDTLELADKNLRNLEGFTEPLGQKGDMIAETLLRAVDGVDTLIEDFRVLVQALNNREGTIGRLLYEPQTYENLNRLMGNANQVLAQLYELTRQARPVVENVKIMTDKLAREPGRLVTGGLNPSPIK